MTPIAAPLAGAVAFVSGAGSGIGGAVARRLSQLGAAVVGFSASAQRLADTMRSLPGPAHAEAFDIRDRRAIERALAGLPGELRSPSILVNCAGVALGGLEPAHRASPDDWDEMIDVNARGLVHLTRAVLPAMVDAQRGHVINIGSVAGTYPYPGGNVYGATKAFVQQFSLNLREDLLGTGIRVTCIEPGMTVSRFNERRFGDSRRGQATYRGVTPLSAEDVAELAGYAATLPAHVNVTRLEVVPVQQAGAYRFHRREEDPGDAR